MSWHLHNSKGLFGRSLSQLRLLLLRRSPVKHFVRGAVFQWKIEKSEPLWLLRRSPTKHPFSWFTLSFGVILNTKNMLNYAQYLIILMKYICLKLWLLQLAWSSIQLSDYNIWRNKTKENTSLYIPKAALDPLVKYVWWLRMCPS